MILISGALEDYLLARVGLKCGLFSAFVPGHQAIEKFLKAYILLKDPIGVPNAETLRRAIGQRVARQPGLPSAHNLTGLWNWAADLRNAASEEPVPPILDHLNWWYVHRYPDNPNSGGSSSTAKLREIDTAVFEVWSWFEAQDEYMFLSHGLSFYLASVLEQREVAQPYLTMLSDDNAAYKMFKIKHLSRIDALFEPASN